MWIIFGVTAIIAAVLNIIWTVQEKDAKWFSFLSLSLTVLTLCDFYSMNKTWVLHKDWSALEDVVPGVSDALWFLTITSILINSVSFIVPLFRSRKK